MTPPSGTYVKSERQLARERYRRSRAFRSAGIAGASSLIVVVALVVGIVSM